jgi:hypothetical protein
MSSVLLVDLESGSVGVALAQLHKTDKPRLSAEKRVHFPTLHRIHSDLLLTQTHKAASAALVHASEVATRLRSHPQTLAAGTISRADIFLSGPWAEVRFASAGNVKHHAHTAMTNLVRPMVAALFGDIPIAFHTFSNAAGFVANGIWGSEPYLLCTITGEMTEISARGPHGLLGHATFPTGHASLVRTLMTHANMSESEARSAMRLGGSHLSEVFASAAQHFTDEFHIVAQKLLTHTPARTMPSGLQKPWPSRAPFLLCLYKLAQCAPCERGPLRPTWQHTHPSPICFWPSRPCLPTIGIVYNYGYARYDPARSEPVRWR